MALGFGLVGFVVWFRDRPKFGESVVYPLLVVVKVTCPGDGIPVSMFVAESLQKVYVCCVPEF